MSSNDFDFSEAREQTNEELAGQLARLEALTSSDIAALVPDMGDQQEIARIIAAINAASDRNRKMAILQQNLQAGGSVLAGLVGRVI